MVSVPNDLAPVLAEHPIQELGDPVARLQPCGFGRMPMGFEESQHHVGMDPYVPRPRSGGGRVGKPGSVVGIGSQVAICLLEPAEFLGDRPNARREILIAGPVRRSRRGDQPLTRVFAVPIARAGFGSTLGPEQSDRFAVDPFDEPRKPSLGRCVDRLAERPKQADARVQSWAKTQGRAHPLEWLSPSSAGKNTVFRTPWVGSFSNTLRS